MRLKRNRILCKICLCNKELHAEKVKPLFELGKMFSIDTILFSIWNGKENMILFITSITIWKYLTECFALSLHPSRWRNNNVLGLRPCGTRIVCTGFPSICIQTNLPVWSFSKQTHEAYFPLHTFAHPPLVSIDFRKLKSMAVEWLSVPWS